jgi:hypothetical protein
VLTPTDSFAPFRLAPALLYANAFEWAISTMETSLIASKNAVRLLRDELAAAV